MDSLTKPEMLLSGGAIILVGGTTWYLNSRINTFEETLQQLTDRFGVMISRIHQHDDDVKITKVKLTEIESFSSHLKKIQEEFKELKATLGNEFNNIEELINKQNKKLTKVNQRVDLLFQHLGINIQTELESNHVYNNNEDMLLNESIPPGNQDKLITKKKKGKTNKRLGLNIDSNPVNNIQLNNREIVKDKDKYLEENVLEEMAGLGIH